MIELSAVPIPANPNALVQARSFKGWKDGEFEILKGLLSTKGAIPYKKFPLAEKDAAWDGPAVVKECDIEDLAKISAWKDSSKDTADLTKSDFKLPHHEGPGEGYKTVWAGVKAAMGALLGARGGVDIPEGDVDKVFSHLKRHYEDFGEEAPEKSLFDDARLALKTLAMRGIVTTLTKGLSVRYNKTEVGV
jgi:hypothetical protein